eukprot:m.81034 g.81034  ORF g.81034 m.81034 type:complete len:108 (+) comp36213_c0_seq11:1373-1696(+)
MQNILWSQCISVSSSLKCLNVEGNQLAGLPCGMLDLSNIQQLHVENNFMHPFFWAENIINQPQRLTDLSSLCIVKNELNQLYGPNMPSDIKHILNQYDFIKFDINAI